MMIEMFVLQKAPVPLLHLPEKDMLTRQSAVFEMNQIIIKRFQKILLLFIEITFKINNKFLKSRHISRNSVVEELHFFFCGYADHAEQPVDRRKREFLLRDLEHTAAVPHHLAYLHFSPLPGGILTEAGNSFPDFP
nr:hypothetical protein [Chryseobacterium hagamense]